MITEKDTRAKVTRDIMDTMTTGKGTRAKAQRSMIMGKGKDTRAEATKDIMIMEKDIRAKAEKDTRVKARRSMIMGRDTKKKVTRHITMIMILVTMERDTKPKVTRDITTMGKDTNPRVLRNMIMAKAKVTKVKAKRATKGRVKGIRNPTNRGSIIKVMTRRFIKIVKVTTVN